MTILQQAPASLALRQRARLPEAGRRWPVLRAASWSALLAAVSLAGLGWPTQDLADTLLLAVAWTTGGAALASLLALAVGGNVRLVLRAVAALAAIGALSSALVGVAGGWFALAWLLPASAAHAALLVAVAAEGWVQAAAAD